VKHKCRMQRQLRLQMDRWAPGRDPRFVDGACQQLIANQIVQIDALPLRGAQHSMDARKRLNAPGEVGHAALQDYQARFNIAFAKAQPAGACSLEGYY
jgi:hypothetical protein